MLRRFVALALALCLFAGVVLADDAYKPYLHKPTVPERPELRLFGEYATNLFSGAATFSHVLEVSPGIHGLAPQLALLYNSQGALAPPTFLAGGWSLSLDQIYRDVNFTPGDDSDDSFIMVLDGNLYELVWLDGAYHAEVDYYYRIQNLTAGWVVTKQDGTKYYFGETAGARLNSSEGYVEKWFLERVEDTFGNEIYYSYEKNPAANDSSAVYPDTIRYNSDQRKEVVFSYEDRSLPVLSYPQGLPTRYARRLSALDVYVDGELVRGYRLDYRQLLPWLDVLENLSYVGSDGLSVLYSLRFDYSAVVPGYAKPAEGFIPPILFSTSSDGDLGVRLLDVDNDGFVDVVKRKFTNQSVWLHDGQDDWILSSWTVPEEIVSATGSDSGVRFADVNRDGFVDLIKARAGVARKVYLNNGTAWVYDSSWSFPTDVVTSGGDDYGVVLLDVDGDGRTDVVRGYDGSRTTWLNTGSGWSSDASWTLPCDLVTSSAEQGVRFVELNGDGLVDILHSESIGAATQKVYVNTGAGWDEIAMWTPPLNFTSAAGVDDGVRLEDVNSDGLTDIVQRSDTQNRAWLNTAGGWLQNDSWVSPEKFITGGLNKGRRLADVNGDGLTDIVVSHNDASQQYVWLKNASVPYLLTNVTSAYGGITGIEYVPSTIFDHTVGGVSLLGFPVWVVSSVSSDGGVPAPFGVTGVANISYAGGRYNFDKQEFRGFSTVFENVSLSSTIHSFYQDDPRRGVEYDTEVYDHDDVLYARTLKDFNHTVEDGVYNLSLRFVTVFQYDGTDEPMVTNTSYYYNRYGNYEYIVDHGDVAVNGDELFYNYSYGFNTDDWIVDKVARRTLYDALGRKVSEKKLYYDGRGLTGVGFQGALTKTEEWNDQGANTFAWYAYDDYGNVVKRTDSLGGVTSYRYDKYHTFVESVVNPLGHVSSFTYDAGTGNLLSEEHHGVNTSYVYDVFGRIQREIRPYDTAQQPTKSYAYAIDGFAPEYVTVSQKTTTNKTLDTTYVYDGFGRLVRLVGPGDEHVVKDFFYDEEGRIWREALPYYSSDALNLSLRNGTVGNITYSYDALGRVVEVQNPGGTVKSVAFDRYNVTALDENNHTHVYELDGRGRIVAVDEYNEAFGGAEERYRTSYAYDAADNLVSITDAVGNVFSFSYDSLGRKVSMDDPDLGSWTYDYDSLGRLVSQTDARGQEVSLSYDASGRVTAKESSDVNLSFAYDGQYPGTLSNITINDNVTFSFAYDERLRPVLEVQDFGNGVVFNASYAYDGADRLIRRTGAGGSLSYLFDAQGLVGAIPGFVDEVSYAASGALASKAYGNGLETTYGYDARNRLSSIVSDVQDISYTYDGVGNVLSINDSGLLHAMTYDSLDRLSTVTIGSDSYRYSFGEVGNLQKMVVNDEAKYYHYAGSQAHAPSLIVVGGPGLDVAAVADVDSDSRSRVFEAWLENDASEGQEGVDVNVSFGDGSDVEITGLSITDDVLLLVGHNYSSGGDYDVSFATAEDERAMAVKFGMRATSLGLLYSDEEAAILEFLAENDVQEEARNVGWNCSNDLASLYSLNLTGNGFLFDWMLYNLSSPGLQTVTCAVDSDDGSDEASVSFMVEGLSVDEYDVLVENVSKRVLSFEVGNSFKNVTANVSFVGSGDNLSWSLVNFSTGEKILVFAEVDYAHDGVNSFVVNVTSGTEEVVFEDGFNEMCADIEEYVRVPLTALTQVLLFEVKNNWYAGNVSWNVSDPALGDTVYLGSNESVLVFVGANYLEGVHTPQIISWTDTYVDSLSDYFEVRPLDVVSLSVLAEGSSAVSEAVVANHLDEPQVFDWGFGDGVTNVSGSGLNVSDDVMLFIGTNYSSQGVYVTSFFVNSSSYADSASGVIVNG